MQRILSKELSTVKKIHKKEHRNYPLKISEIEVVKCDIIIQSDKCRQFYWLNLKAFQ